MGCCFSRCFNGDQEYDSKGHPIQRSSVGNQRSKKKVHWADKDRHSQRGSDPPQGSMISFISAPPNTGGMRKPLYDRVLPESASGTGLVREWWQPCRPGHDPFERQCVIEWSNGYARFAYERGDALPCRYPAGLFTTPHTPYNSRDGSAEETYDPRAPAKHYKFRPNEYTHRSELSQESYYSTVSQQPPHVQQSWR